MIRLYLVAGELSGDAHGAALMRDIAAQSTVPVQFSGAGGPEMQRLAGKNFTEWTSHAVVGLWEVIKNYGYFRSQFHRMIAEIGQVQPDAVILIDYPGFNLRLAKALRAKFPKLKIIYYISPQVWAWNRGRIPKMAKWLDLMICLFPFEKDLYDRSGLRTEFAGHPMLDELEKKRIPGVERDSHLIGLFPGSREREIRKIFPIMLEAAQLLAEKHPQLRFAVPAASEKLESLIRSMIPPGLASEVQLRTSATLMQTCAAGLIASGTATLEATFFNLPYALIYKVSPLTYEVGRRVIRVPFLGMANILAGREVIPEFIQQNARPDLIVAALEPMIFNPIRRAQLDADLKSVIATLGSRGASHRAAAAVLKCLGNVSQSPVQT
ncbi:MAG TPA: lipid-A-disaccharide synthase [Chthoniobacterales bacterium]